MIDHARKTLGALILAAPLGTNTACSTSSASTPGCEFLRDMDGCWQQRLAEAEACAVRSAVLEEVDLCTADSMIYELDRTVARDLPDGIRAMSGDELCFEANRTRGGFELETRSGTYSQELQEETLTVQCSGQSLQTFQRSDFSSCTGELPGVSQQQDGAGGDYHFSLRDLKVDCLLP